MWPGRTASAAMERQAFSGRDEGSGEGGREGVREEERERGREEGVWGGRERREEERMQ